MKDLTYELYTNPATYPHTDTQTQATYTQTHTHTDIRTDTDGHTLTQTH